MDQQSRTIYRMYDQAPQGKGVHAVADHHEATHWNEKQWGVYWTAQSFEGERKIKNLKRVLCWAIDIDKGTKSEQWARLDRFPLPSLVIETKRGYQVYWYAKDATAENYQSIVCDRLVYHFDADPNAKDLARILRAPWYMHWKDPNSPFLCEVVHYTGTHYTEDQMLRYFPLPEEKQIESVSKQEVRRVFSPNGDDLWERIYNLDCEQALMRLSGKGCVGSETFTFRRTTSGNLNILVNGKATSCWLDKNKRIGSSDHGGPTVYQWINWYQRDTKKTYQVIKEEFPELWKNLK